MYNIDYMLKMRKYKKNYQRPEFIEMIVAANQINVNF